MNETCTVDAHAGGTPVRLITAGAPAPRGRGMREKTEWMARRADHVRRALMLEPRGHRDMTGVMLTEPVSPGSHAGLIFMHADGYASMAGHAIIATTLLAVSRGLIVPGGDGRSLTYDTVAGRIPARIIDDAVKGGASGPARSDVEASAVSALGARVSFTNVPSFVLAGGLSIKASGRQVRADVAFGGAFYAIVDAESLGLSAGYEHLGVLRQFSREIVQAIESVVDVTHPLDHRVTGLAGTMFTAPATGANAHLRNVTVLATGGAGRAASGTGLSAILAVLDAMGVMTEEEPFALEGLSGERLTGRIASRTMVGDLPAVTPEIEGSAWVTGEHRFVAAHDDPFSRGFETTARST
ncbi:MAG: proline racemase [Acidimicrobiia bacterium]|nr:proline racemase [Acidimicrobiia bacterium]